MTVTADQVRAKINASEASVPEAELEAAIAVAEALVSEHVGEEQLEAVPETILDRAVLLVAVEQVNQDKAPNGVLNQVFDIGVGEASSTPVRIGRDPMKPAYPILAPWASGRFFCA